MSYRLPGCDFAGRLLFRMRRRCAAALRFWWSQWREPGTSGSSVQGGFAMPRPVPVPVRRVICRRIEQGDDVSTIAEELHLSTRTVRHLVHRFLAGEVNQEPDYSRCGRRSSTGEPPLLCEAVALREQHPRWGAGLIRVILKEAHPRQTIPSERTIRRWLSRAGGGPAPRGRRPASESQRAQQPHEVWQVDAADQKRLQTGQQISWLRFVDECSGGVLKTVVFSRSKLQLRAPAPHPGRLPGLLCALGSARTAARRQRFAVGLFGRPAAGSVVVAVGPGLGCSLEPTIASPGKWSGRTLPRDRQKLGRAVRLHERGRTATGAGSHGSYPARTLSVRGRTLAPAGMAGPVAFGSFVHAPLGTSRLELWSRAGSSFCLCRDAPRGQDRSHHILQSQPLRGHDSLRQDRLRDARSRCNRMGVGRSGRPSSPSPRSQGTDEIEHSKPHRRPTCSRHSTKAPRGKTFVSELTAKLHVR